jgi:flavin-dependent dehydrogenase
MDGGDLFFMDDDGSLKKVATVGGTIAAGRFASFPHGNEHVDRKVRRHSYVVYLDRRCASSSYDNYTVFSRLQMEEFISEKKEREGAETYPETCPETSLIASAQACTSSVGLI